MATNPDDIKRIINEEVKIFEADIAPHAQERINARLDKMVTDGDITSAEAGTIKGNLDKMLRHNYGEKSYGIRIGKFHVDPNLRPELISMDGGRPYYRIWSDNKDDVLRDSTGNEFWGVIRNNRLVTMFLRKDYQRRSAHKVLNDDGGLGVDEVIDNFDDFLANGGRTDKEIEQENEKLRAQANRQAKENEGNKIINIDGVNWVINDAEQRVQKKNKPSVYVTFDDVLDYPNWDEATKNEIVSRMD
jgi:hypothetical protein